MPVASAPVVSGICLCSSLPGGGAQVRPSWREYKQATTLCSSPRGHSSGPPPAPLGSSGEESGDPMAKRFLGNRLIGVGSKVVAVGRNYAEHAKELGNAVPKEPLLFMKPTSSYVHKGGSIQIPAGVKELHHEVELGVVIAKTARDIPLASAMDHVAGYVALLDMTARDLQKVAKAEGLPWEMAKCQDTFTPLSGFVPRSKVADPSKLELWCKVDGELRQKGPTSDMLWDVPALISHISKYFTLMTGDLIATGTPSGVGAVRAGQTITAGITGLVEMSFPVVMRQPAHPGPL